MNGHIKRIGKALNSTRRQIGNALLGLLIILTLFSAYGGMINPGTNAWGALCAMCFPGFIVVDIALLIIELVLRQKGAVVAIGITIIASMPALADYTPVNFRKTAGEGADTFTLMTFNSMWWGEYGNTGDSIAAPNKSVAYILEQNPDIFATQEGSRITENAKLGITKAMADSINRRYPYQFYSEGEIGQMLYSRYPVTRLISEDLLNGTGVYVAYRISIQGHLLTLINVHLQSIGLTPADKALYMELTKARASEREISEVKNQLFDKLFAAFKHRALQAEFLRSIIDDTKGNVIVSGDFNDIPGCYAIRTVKGDDLRDAWADAGFGPGITYHANHMFFRIDHILYRGDFRAIDTRVPHSGSSDHYPMIATFEWDNN